MSGGLFARAAARELGRDLSPEETETLQRRHGELFREFLPERRPLPGAVELLAYLRANNITHGITATPSFCWQARNKSGSGLARLTSPRSTTTVSGGTRKASSEASISGCLLAVEDCYVVGDAVWDLLAARRARMLGIGVLSGGYGEDELSRAGAFRVYRDAAMLKVSLDELGVAP